MVRNIIAVVAGWLAAAALWLMLFAGWYVAASFIAPRDFPLPPRPDLAPAFWFLAGTLVCDAVAGFVAGYLIAWMARKPAHRLMWGVTVVVVVLLLLQAVADLRRLPAWLGLARVLISPMSMWAGAHLRGLDPTPPGPQPHDLREGNLAC